MQVGDTVQFSGFFTQAKGLRMRPSQELESRLGYRAGRLDQGWWLLFMTRLPKPDEFEFRGHTTMPGGVIRGHLPNPPDRRTSEQRMKDNGYDLLKIKKGQIENLFKISGADRLAKVIPVRDKFGDRDFPPGSGLPQWELIKPVPFKVAAFISPGRTYDEFYI